VTARPLKLPGIIPFVVAANLSLNRFVTVHMKKMAFTVEIDLKYLPGRQFI
jgi:hypothetical protein